jgi:hypothetical protein
MALIAAEVVLRVAGVTPYQPRADIENEPLVHVPDDVRGWRTSPGHFVAPAYVPGGVSTEVTILPDGSRATAPAPSTADVELLFVGCSFTFGWAISDDETMAWRVQHDRPDLHVVNRGVNAYGTYQALLLLEELLGRGERPARVIYGFHEVHEERNVAAPRWLEMLDRNAHRGNVAVPYATLDENDQIVRHAPQRYPAWPLRDRLATVAFLERVYAGWTGAARVGQARRVTERSLLALRDLCAQHGIPFAVVFLQASPATARHYAAFLQRSKIPFADCVVPITPALRVPGEGHPNGTVNARWAECVEKTLLPQRAA